MNEAFKYSDPEIRDAEVLHVRTYSARSPGGVVPVGRPLLSSGETAWFLDIFVLVAFVAYVLAKSEDLRGTRRSEILARDQGRRSAPLVVGQDERSTWPAGRVMSESELRAYIYEEPKGSGD